MNPEKNLDSAFDAGFFSASASLSVLAGNKIDYNPLYTAQHSLFPDIPFTLPFDHADSEFLVTTEIFGDVTGKSYLFLNRREYALLTASVPESSDQRINLKEEFLKEADNIISASVITRLANKLNLKMYGDIPRLVERAGRSLEEILSADFNGQSEEVYVNAMLFYFDAHPAVKPLFIWVLDSRVFSKLPVA